MSKTAQIVIWVIVAVIVIGGVWWWIASNQTSGTPTNPYSPTSQATPPANQGTAQGATSTSNTIVSNGTSDNNLDQDMTNINAQMNGLSSDSANVDASVASSSAQ
jgi:hypothetical protein